MKGQDYKISRRLIVDKLKETREALRNAKVSLAGVSPWDGKDIRIKVWKDVGDDKSDRIVLPAGYYAIMGELVDPSSPLRPIPFGKSFVLNAHR